MLKFTVSAAVLGMFLLFAGPASADGYRSHGPSHGGYQYHGSSYHGDHGYYGGYSHRVYAPPVYRPRVIYPAPYVVPQPLFAQPVYPGYGCYHAPGNSLYLQGRNFSLGFGF